LSRNHTKLSINKHKWLLIKRIDISRQVSSVNSFLLAKLVIDELIKYADDVDVKLKIAAYHHMQVGNNYCILVFIENINSFCFLTNDTKYPKHLCRETFVVKKPRAAP
jgi:hypothetical protein